MCTDAQDDCCTSQLRRVRLSFVACSQPVALSHSKCPPHDNGHLPRVIHNITAQGDLRTMAAPVGSSVFFVSALLVICLLVLLLIRYYLPLRSTPGYLIFPVFLSLALPSSIILLVPIDLASHAVAEDETARGIWLPDRALLVTWRIAYWLTFMLTWYVLLRSELRRESNSCVGSHYLFLGNIRIQASESQETASYTRCDQMADISSQSYLWVRWAQSTSSLVKASTSDR